MTDLRKITGILTAMILAVVLAACDRPQEKVAEQQAPAEKTQAPPEKTAEQKAPPPEEKAPEQKSSSTAAQDDPDIIPEIAMVPFSPGGVPPTTTQSAFGRKIMNDPEQIAAGKQLFSAMNCVGCHFHGGGGMGPALMDDVWTYGSSIENIAASIREGRPNGMPSFRDRVPEEQIWQLAAYALSLSKPELQPSNASTGASSGDPTPAGSN